jgi:hypothetical protein
MADTALIGKLHTHDRLAAPMAPDRRWGRGPAMAVVVLSSLGLWAALYFIGAFAASALSW